MSERESSIKLWHKIVVVAVPILLGSVSGSVSDRVTNAETRKQVEVNTRGLDNKLDKMVFDAYKVQLDRIEKNQERIEKKQDHIEDLLIQHMDK